MSASVRRLLRTAATSFILYATFVAAGNIVLVHAGARANQRQQSFLPRLREGACVKALRRLQRTLNT